MAETDGNGSTPNERGRRLKKPGADADHRDSTRFDDVRAVLDVVERKRSRALSRLAKENSNPLYAWEALRDAVTSVQCWSQESRERFAKPFEKTAVPNWVLWHLTDVANQLLTQAQGRDPWKRRSHFQRGDIPGRRETEISAAAALSRLSATMYLSRQGWNAFAEYRTRAIAENAAILNELLLADGVSAKERSASLRQYLGMYDARNLRKILAKGADSYIRKEGKI
jgi:hypothetical protein